MRIQRRSGLRHLARTGAPAARQRRPRHHDGRPRHPGRSSERALRRHGPRLDLPAAHLHHARDRHPL